MKWNTWGPIQGTSQVVFGWSDTTITLMVAWGPIVYIISFLPISWLMDTKGENKLNCSKQGLVDWYFFVNNEVLRDINNTKTLHIDRPTRSAILNSWHLIRFLGMPAGLDNLELGLDRGLWSLDRTLAYTCSNYSFLDIWLLILGQSRDHFVFFTQHLCIENVFRVCIAWCKSERVWENSRQWCKRQTKSRVCSQEFSQCLSVYIRVCKHRKKVFYCF